MAGALITRNARLAAAAIGLATWTGLGLQLVTAHRWTGSVLGATWFLSRFFTIMANLAVALAFTGVALGRAAFGAPGVMGGLTLAIVLVGTVYNLLLSNLAVLHGMALLADVIVHCVTPVAVPLFWLVFVPKGSLSRRDPWRWAAFPVAFLVYALVRGPIEHAYAYPFIDVPRIGWPRTVVNVSLIALGFVVASFALVGLDHRLGRRRPRR